jgi:hypothetical protein
MLDKPLLREPGLSDVTQSQPIAAGVQFAWNSDWDELEVRIEQVDLGI